MAPLLFLSIQNRSGRKCSRMANSSALPFPIPSGAGDVVPLDGGIRDCGDSCTKSEGLELRKGPKTWCKRNERTRFCGSLCTKSEGLELRKGPKTWCKGNEGIRFCGSLCTKSEGLELRKRPKTWCKGNGGIRFCGDSCTKSAPAGRRRAKSAPAAPKNNKKRENTRSLRVRSAFVGSCRQSIFPRF